MRNFFAAVALLAGTALVPALASAQTIPGDVNPNASATICVNLQNDLSRGTSDAQTAGEVSVLQIFLQSTSTPGSTTPYLTGDPTGFFGIQTENAVKQFQTDQQLLSSGYVGPLTRARIRTLTCGGGTTTQSFSATPLSSAAPLAVTFTFPASLGNFLPGAPTYSVDFGDGSTLALLTCNQLTCSAPITIQHTYAAAGTYTAALKSQNASLPPPFGTVTTVGVQTITVTAGQTDTGGFSVSPSSGAAPLTVSATFPQTWRALVTAECANNQPRLGGRSFSIDWGDGTFPQQNGRVAPCATHTYTVAGTYTVSAKIYDFSDVPAFNGQFTQTVWTGSATVTVGGGATGSPSITVGSPGTGLSVAQGQTLRISWSAQNAPSGSVVALWLTDPNSSGNVITLIRGQQPTTGTYDWVVPTTYCEQDVCGVPLRTGSYTIDATLYTPSNAYLYGFPPANPVVATKLAGAASGIFTVTGGSTTTVCTDLRNDLSLNATDAKTNGEVSLLQAFLQSTPSAGGFPYLSGTPTGYFGFLTQSAVRLFQSEHGLLAAGFVGPATRTQIKVLTCGGTTPAVSFSATPSSGSAPLTVVFGVNTRGLYKIDFGDSTQEEFDTRYSVVECATGSTSCPVGFKTHTYASAGTYTANLQQQIVCITTPCVAPVLGTVTITVTGSDLPPPPEAECTDLQNELSYRSTDSQTGGEVSLLQAFFQAATSPTTGVQYLTGEPTGFFGQLTKAAVIQFQRDNNLTATGVVDSATRAKIKEISCHVTPPPPPIAECTDLQNDLSLRSTDSQTGGEVSLLQAFFQSVTSSGTGAPYLTGEPTGFFGQLTKAAVIQFQKDKGLTATGIVNSATRAKIRTLTCGDTPPPPPPPPEVCNVDAEMQSCINGAYAARIGPDCSWLACPYKPVVPTAPAINSFTAAATSLAYEGSTNLSWSVASSTGTTCSLSVNGGTSSSVPASNSAYNTGALAATTKYTLSCSTGSGPVATRDVTVKVASRELSCVSQQQPQYVYGYGKLDADGKPFIRLQGNCSYFTGYSVFDTGWVQGAQLSKSGNCPVGYGLAVTANASIDKTGLNVTSSYGGGYEGSCTATWPASFKWPSSSSTDTRPGPTVDLAQSSVSSYGQNSLSWKSTNADSCTIAYSTDGLKFTNWQFGTSGSNVSASQISGFNSPGTWVFRATCTGNGAPAVDKVTHTILSEPNNTD